MSETNPPIPNPGLHEGPKTVFSAEPPIPTVAIELYVPPIDVVAQGSPAANLPHTESEPDPMEIAFDRAALEAERTGKIQPGARAIANALTREQITLAEHEARRVLAERGLPATPDAMVELGSSFRAAASDLRGRRNYSEAIKALVRSETLSIIANEMYYRQQH